MSTRNLGKQFGALVDAGRAQGIEMLPTMPGMARIGKLHVPVSNFDVTQNDSLPNLSDFEVTAPDEHGNLYSIGGWPDGGLYGVIHGPGSSENGDQVYFDSADDFADIYGKLGQPDDETRSANAREIAMRRSAMTKMGGGPGTVHAQHFPIEGEGSDIMQSYLLDPGSGDISPAKMSFWNAMTDKDGQ
jgi:hypothetical protein